MILRAVEPIAMGASAAHNSMKLVAYGIHATPSPNIQLDPSKVYTLSYLSANLAIYGDATTVIVDIYANTAPI